MAPSLDEPLQFERIFVEKVWGGRALERTPGIKLPAEKLIGETWELSDRSDRNSIVKGGRFAGAKLRDLVRDHCEALLGRAKPGAEGCFPLLVKLLDARENLSVQVHPHAGVAGSLPKGDRPKTECWTILAADKGSAIWLGLKPGVDAKTFAKKAAGAEVVELLVRHEPRPGQFYFVPGGTVHAIGAGVALVEVQETADTTYRLYDWGRKGLDGKPREVHVEQALGVVRFDGDANGPVTPRFPKDRSGAKLAALVDCPEFAVDLLEVQGALATDTDGVATVYVVLSGRGRFVRADGRESWPLGPGDTWLAPASLARHRIQSAGALRLLRARTKA